MTDDASSHAKIGVPADPKIFHITHIDNLPGILQEGGLWCDRERINRGLGNTNIGLHHIKSRRLLRAVHASCGGTIGEYVPFNFCPRSVMLYAVHRGHQNYDGGQGSIIHLVSRVRSAVALGREWFFTDRHAEVGHALHLDSLDRLEEVPWKVMPMRQWQEVKEERQAEFLVRSFFPWTAIESIAVIDEATRESVNVHLGSSSHRPEVYVRREWYY
jgi:hypothetical protein